MGVPDTREANAASGGGALYRPLGVGPRLALKLISSKALRRKAPFKEAAAILGNGRQHLDVSPVLLDSSTASYDAPTRTAQVIILEVGRGNSRDKHFYGADTIRKAAVDKVFDGAQAYADHPGLDEDINRPERSVRDLVGYYFNTREVEVTNSTGETVPALAASMKIQEGADWAIGLIREAISFNTRYPNKTYVGISINADGDVSPAIVDGEQVNYVHRITEAFSADMVTKPARGGKFLALVESQSGSHKPTKKEQAVDTKIFESAARLRKQEGSGEIDRDEFRSLVALIEAEQSKTMGATLGESAANEKDLLESLSEADKNVYNSLDEADKPPWLTKKISEAKLKASKTREADGADGQDGEDGEDGEDGQDGEDGEDGEDGNDGKNGKSVKESVRESDPKKAHPALFAAALREARSAVSGDVAALRAQVAEMTARSTMRESIDTAKRKLTESSLPAAAATMLIESLVGKSSGEMDRLIEAQVAYLDMLGVSKTNKQTAGAGEKTLPLRESESKANESFIFAGMGGN
jgi:CYTH domain-containing protein